jgi:ABC-2 type transport system ATP-binding protein
MNAVSIRNVTKTFGAHRAVDELTLDVPTGSIYGFIGPNGSGKSTTLRMITNIILPDSGEIEVLGARDMHAARDRVGYLPEERGLYRKMKLRRLLRYFGELKGMRGGSLDARIDEWLAKMGLSKWANHKVEALSKGMSQKVQFIAAAISEPDLMILDEPFSGLDPVNQEVLKDAVLEGRRRGATIIFSTHDMAAAEKMCDRIFMIFRGKKVLDGSLDEIQATYGADTIRLRASADSRDLGVIPEVETINDYGQIREVRLKAGSDPQAFLKRVASTSTIQHFEMTRPSLHDIFVRIARPEREAVAS